MTLDTLSQRECCCLQIHLYVGMSLLYFVAMLQITNKLAMDRRKRTYACAALIVGAALLEEEEMEARKPRRKWCEEWLMKRDTSSSSLRRDFRLETHLFQMYMRLPVPIFYFILEKIRSRIERQDTHLRMSIGAATRFEITLLYLISGVPYSRLQYQTRIHSSALSKIIPEVCTAIYEVLGNDFIKTPHTPDEWIEVANDFQNKWQFSNCLGAVDGKHIAISPPHDSGSYYYSYKGFHSIVLLAVANANYEVIYFDLEANSPSPATAAAQQLRHISSMMRNTATWPGTVFCANIVAGERCRRNNVAAMLNSVNRTLEAF